MNFVKVRYLKADKPQGRAYTFRTEDDLSALDVVDLPGGKHGIVVANGLDASDREWIEKNGEENIKVVKKHAEESESKIGK